MLFTQTDTVIADIRKERALRPYEFILLATTMQSTSTR